jgi:hypothetical protein
LIGSFLIIESIFARCYPQTESQELALGEMAFILIAESRRGHEYAKTSI